MPRALIGGEGNDTLIGGSGQDYLDGGAGIDTVVYAASPVGVRIDLANGTARGGDAAAVEKARSAFGSPVIVAVISAPVDSPKVPEWEQFLSAGAVCLGLVNAALAAGYGAAWLTGPAVLDETFGRTHLGLSEHERIVGLVHIGSRGETPPERPRPDVAAHTVFL